MASKDSFIGKAKKKAKAIGYTGPFWFLSYLIFYIINNLGIVIAMLLPSSLGYVFHRMRGVKIGKNVHISRGACIDHSVPMFIEIGDNSQIAFGAVVLCHNNEASTDEANQVKPVKIGNNVFVSVNAVILPGVSIGDNSKIGASAVVNKDIPKNSLAVGQPARVVKKI